MKLRRYLSIPSRLRRKEGSGYAGILFTLAGGKGGKEAEAIFNLHPLFHVGKREGSGCIACLCGGLSKEEKEEGISHFFPYSSSGGRKEGKKEKETAAGRFFANPFVRKGRIKKELLLIIHHQSFD